MNKFCLRSLLTFMIAFICYGAEASIFSDCADLLRSSEFRNAKFSSEMDAYIKTGWAHPPDPNDRLALDNIERKLSSWRRRIVKRLIRDGFADRKMIFEGWPKGFPLERQNVLFRFGKAAALVPEDIQVYYNPQMDFTRLFLEVSSPLRELYVSHRALYYPQDLEIELGLIHEMVHIAFYDYRVKTGNSLWNYKLIANTPELRKELHPFLLTYADHYSPEEVFARLVTGLINADLVCEENRVPDVLELADIAVAMAFLHGHRTKISNLLTHSFQDPFLVPEIDTRKNSILYTLNFDDFRLFITVAKAISPSLPPFSSHMILAGFIEENIILERLATALRPLGPTGATAEMFERFQNPTSELLENLCRNRDTIWKALDESGINFSQFRRALD